MKHDEDHDHGDLDPLGCARLGLLRLFCGAVPAYRERDVVEERVVTSREMVYEPAPASPPAPVVEPESSDTTDDAL